MNSKRIIYLVLLLQISLFSALKAEYTHSSIDTVYSFLPGSGQNIGQDFAYFPKNIFGLPSSIATDYVPASTPSEVCSLGMGGEITVGFKDFIISDGDGPDFTIFENVFIMSMLNKKFVEPAQVSVSQDGINFTAFPFDSLTLHGCAGTEPTHGDKSPFDPTVSGGNSFDLKTVGLTWAKYIRIKDVSQFVLANPHHPFYNASISGFDLDAVTGINLTRVKPENNNNNILTVTSKTIYVNYKNLESIEFSIYNTLGSRIIYGNQSSPEINANLLNSGVYLVYLVINDKSKSTKYIKQAFYVN